MGRGRDGDGDFLFYSGPPGKNHIIAVQKLGQQRVNKALERTSDLHGQRERPLLFQK